MLFELQKRLKTFHKGGIHPPDNKLSATARIEEIPLPRSVTIPIYQHIGTPPRVIVERGDTVRVGQVLAIHEGLVSANIHSSVSGKVGKIDRVLDSSGYKHIAINIRVKEDDWLEEIDRSEDLIDDIPYSSKEIIQKVMEAGVVGQGGAAFPSHVKLSIPENRTVDTLIINGVECEPYLTADHRIMLERPYEIFVGTQILMKATGATKAIIAIENNKQDAIQLLSSIADDYPNIDIEALQVQYPQGGERQLIEALLDREVPSGGLPIDVGTIVHNVGTTYSVYQAVQKNQPLIQRVVTVTGPSVSKPSNFMVRIGTSVADLIAAAGGVPEDTGKIINGGPMMGKAIQDLKVPITKATSGILLIPEKETWRSEEYNCVRCGKCIEVCPMGLEPMQLVLLAKGKAADKAEAEHILDCMECGSCSFVCPSNRPILDYIRYGKGQVKKEQIK
ncbi:MAG: electron transport complex subunit RsxC [Cyclobacteriaceae bacterium]|nr:electron transport complex subunit RsxC [Cyclobacteriaceae bacterium HetDA_MAG_MS6]